MACGGKFLENSMILVLLVVSGLSQSRYTARILELEVHTTISTEPYQFHFFKWFQRTVSADGFSGST